MQIEVRIEDGATPDIAAMVQKLGPARLHALLGNAARSQIRDHLEAKGQLPNKHGWPKTGWLTRARDSVVMTSDENSAVITIALEGFASRYYGQPPRITPKNRRYLTIPMCAAAYGKAAREFTDLHAEMYKVPRGRTAGFLVRSMGPVKVRMYRLVLWTEPKADPTLMPTDSEIRGHCMEVLESAAMAAAARRG